MRRRKARTGLRGSGSIQRMRPSTVAELPPSPMTVEKGSPDCSTSCMALHCSRPVHSATVCPAFTSAKSAWRALSGTCPVWGEVSVPS